jgi:P27 family predicted phage terminase small subunit
LLGKTLSEELKMAERGPKPPPRLSKEAGEWWRKLTGLYNFDDPQLLVLQTALESFDRMREAQKALQRNGGLTIRDRFSQPKPHPATVVERDSRSGMLQSLKLLGVDLVDSE